MAREPRPLFSLSLSCQPFIQPSTKAKPIPLRHIFLFEQTPSKNISSFNKTRNTFWLTKEEIQKNKSAWKIRNKILINLAKWQSSARIALACRLHISHFISASIDLFFFGKHTTPDDNEKAIKITFSVVSRTHTERRPEKRIINVGNWLVSNNALFIMTRWFCQFRDGLEFTFWRWRRDVEEEEEALAYLSVWRSTELWNLWHCFFTSVRSPIANHSLNHSIR